MIEQNKTSKQFNNGNHRQSPQDPLTDLSGSIGGHFAPGYARMEVRGGSHVLHIIPTLGQGGAERLLAELVVRAAGHFRHSILTLVDEAPFFNFEGVSITSLGLRRGEISARAVWRAATIVRAAAPDLIHAWLYHGNLLSALLPGRRKAPLLWSIHNTTLPPGEARRMTRLVNWLCARLSHRVPEQIVYCAEAARTLHEETFGYDRTRGVVVENGVDFATFAFDFARRAALRACWGLEPGESVVGCLGRFDPQKDHATVAAAVARLEGKRTRLVLAGNGCGTDNPALMALLREAGVAARTLALGPVVDVPGLLSALDLLVIGSAFGEALPMVGLEAVASGLPIVATTVGSVADLVLDPAYLAPPREPVALANAIQAALLAVAASPERPSPNAQARRETLRLRYDIATTVARYHGLYNGAILRRNGRAGRQAPPPALRADAGVR